MRPMNCLLIACVTFSVSSCSSATTPQALVVGKWGAIEDGRLTWDLLFTKDGTFRSSNKTLGEATPVDGSFRFIDDNTIEMTINGLPPGSTLSLPGWTSPMKVE